MIYSDLLKKKPDEIVILDKLIKDNGNILWFLDSREAVEIQAPCSCSSMCKLKCVFTKWGIYYQHIYPLNIYKCD